MLSRDRYVPAHRRPRGRASVLRDAVVVCGLVLGLSATAAASASSDTGGDQAAAKQAHERTKAMHERLDRLTGTPSRDSRAADAQRASRSDRRAELAPARNQRREAAQVDPRVVARQIMPEFGFSTSEFGCLDALYVSESNWQVHADNPISSAYGIPQALLSEHDVPAGYMKSAAVQIRWGLGYIRDAYGSPCGAWEFKQANGYY